MKIILKKLLTVALTGVVAIAATLNTAAAENRRAMITFSGHEAINRVQISGTVRVFIIQGKSDWVSIDDDADLNKVSVTQRGGVLMINSTEKTPVSVMVHVKSLYRIEAYNTSKVTTIGVFNATALQILLKDQAYARIRVNTESLYTVSQGTSRMELLGKTGRHVTKTDVLAQLNTKNFTALVSEDENYQLAGNRNTATEDAALKGRADSLQIAP